MNPKELALSFNRAQVGVLLLTAAIAGTAGAYAGATIAIQRLGDKLRLESDDALQVAMAEAKAHYEQKYKKEYKAGNFETPEGAFKALHPKSDLEKAADEALVVYATHEIERVKNEFSSAPPPTSRGDLVEISKNVFTDATIPEAFDLEKELALRDPDFPYLITEEEFDENELEFEQIELTYYAGDGVLANERDEHVNIEQAVGNDNLMRFGQGTNDENKLFIRNVNGSMDFCIVLSLGKYSVEVLDIVDKDEEALELKHSDDRRPRKFRHRDD